MRHGYLLVVSVIHNFCFCTYSHDGCPTRRDTARSVETVHGSIADDGDMSEGDTRSTGPGGPKHDTKDPLRKLPDVPPEDAPLHIMVEYREALDNQLAKLILADVAQPGRRQR